MTRFFPQKRILPHAQWPRRRIPVFDGQNAEETDSVTTVPYRSRVRDALFLANCSKTRRTCCARGCNRDKASPASCDKREPLSKRAGAEEASFCAGGAPIRRALSPASVARLESGSNCSIGGHVVYPPRLQ